MWKIQHSEGSFSLPLGELTVDLICEARESAEDEPQITVKCAEPITVEVHWGDRVKTVYAE